jgi:DNA polymerase-1
MDTTECLVFHHGFGYDFPLLEKLYGYEYKGRKEDTLVMSRLFNPKRPVPPHCPVKNKPHSIETWGYRVGRPKVEHEDWSQFSDNMLLRNQEDAEIGRLVYLCLLEEAKGYTWNPALRLTNKLFQVLHKQEEYGWLADRDWILKSIDMLNHWMERIARVLNQTLPLTIEVEEDIDKQTNTFKWVREPFLRSGKYSQHTLKRMCETDLNPEERVIWGPYTRILIRRLSLDKPSEIKDYLLEQGWEPANWNTNDKGERTSPKLDKDDPFDGVDGGVGRLIAKYIQCKSRRSILEGWLMLIREDGRISSSVANLAETGRATHRGIVNVPNGEAFFGKWMRKCFTSKPDWVLVGTDSKGCQNRMLAARVGDPTFTNTLINGKKENGTSIHHVNQKALREVACLDVSYGKAKNLNYAS